MRLGHIHSVLCLSIQPGTAIWQMWIQLCSVDKCVSSVIQLCLAPGDSMDYNLPALLSMGFPRWEYWNGLPFPPPGDLHDPGIEILNPRLFRLLHYHHKYSHSISAGPVKHYLLSVRLLSGCKNAKRWERVLRWHDPNSFFMLSHYIRNYQG